MVKESDVAMGSCWPTHVGLLAVDFEQVFGTHYGTHLWQFNVKLFFGLPSSKPFTRLRPIAHSNFPPSVCKPSTK